MRLELAMWLRPTSHYTHYKSTLTTSNHSIDFYTKEAGAGGVPDFVIWGSKEELLRLATFIRDSVDPPLPADVEPAGVDGPPGVNTEGFIPTGPDLNRHFFDGRGQEPATAMIFTDAPPVDVTREILTAPLSEAIVPDEDILDES